MTFLLRLLFLCLFTATVAAVWERTQTSEYKRDAILAGLLIYVLYRQERP